MSEREKIQKFWALNKFVVMEHSQEGFIQSREYLKDAELSYDVFENFIKSILKEPVDKKNALKSVFQVWELVKKHASEEEKDKMMNFIIDYKKNKVTLGQVKEKLHSLCKTYNVSQILDSNYFNSILS